MKEKLPPFAKFLWADSKVFWVLLATILLLFVVLGPIITHESFKDVIVGIAPFLLVWAAIGLTIIVHNIVRYKRLKQAQDDEVIVIRTKEKP